ncbi:hypothetical protein F5Y03DRAFT_139441 [Xylaria venustula]|nr:hypothetical protein F5Y03DRAFT_139441 [Xylaria venustula]
MSVNTVESEPMEDLSVQSAKSKTAKPEGMADSEDGFHSFGKLPVELQDMIWEFALPSEILHSQVVYWAGARISYPSMPAMGSVCRGSREIILRYGVWLRTQACRVPIFFIPDTSVLHCSDSTCGNSTTITVTENQVIVGFDSILMRMAIRLNSLERLRSITILASDGHAGKIPALWPKSSDGRLMARTVGCRIDEEEAYYPCTEWTAYYPCTEWTAKRWEEIVVAASRAWLLAWWYVKDPVGVHQEDILDPLKWERQAPNHWISRTLLRLPGLYPCHMKPWHEE